MCKLLYHNEAFRHKNHGNRFRICGWTAFERKGMYLPQFFKFFPAPTALELNDSTRSLLFSSVKFYCDLRICMLCIFCSFSRSKMYRPSVSLQCLSLFISITHFSSSFISRENISKAAKMFWSYQAYEEGGI